MQRCASLLFNKMLSLIRASVKVKAVELCDAGNCKTTLRQITFLEGKKGFALY